MIKMTQISLIFVITSATYPKALYTVIRYISCDLSHNQPISKSMRAIEPFKCKSRLYTRLGDAMNSSLLVDHRSDKR